MWNQCFFATSLGKQFESFYERCDFESQKHYVIEKKQSQSFAWNIFRTLYHLNTPNTELKLTFCVKFFYLVIGVVMSLGMIMFIYFTSPVPFCRFGSASGFPLFKSQYLLHRLSNIGHNVTSKRGCIVLKCCNKRRS